MLDPKIEPKRPPPLPAPPPVPTRRGGALDRLRAFLEIRRGRAAASLGGLAQRVRRRPALAAVVASAVVLASAGAAAVALDLVPDVDLDPFAPPTLATATAEARARPSDAAAQRDLGHALWAAKKRHSAVRKYGRALALDAGVADVELVSHLLASFGGRDQREAEALIVKHQLVGAQDGLETLTRSRAYGVRWAAVRTLDRLGRGTKRNWETAYVLDLDSPRCEVRRTAVEKLGAIGTRRTVSALREARAEDEKTGGWFRSRCLGDRLDDAEQKILARRS